MEPQIAADLGRLFRSPYSEAALGAALPPPEAGKPAEYHAALALPLVRIQVDMVWDGLWRSCAHNVARLDNVARADWERRVEAEAKRLAHWVCAEHLPYAQDEVVDIAKPVYLELLGLLQSPDVESELPPLPRPTAVVVPTNATPYPSLAKDGPRPGLGGWIWRDEDFPAEDGESVENPSAPSPGSTTQETAPAGPREVPPPPADLPERGAIRCNLPSENLLLRRESIRTAIVNEARRRRRNEEPGRKKDRHRDGMEESALLKRALAPFLDPMLDGNITRRLNLTASKDTAHEIRAKKLIQKAGELFDAALVPIEQSGQALELSAVVFLKSAHEWALSNRRLPPAYVVRGNTHPAKKARDYAGILAFLGDLHRKAKAGEGDGFAGLPDISGAVRGAKGGTIYQRIADLTTDLVTLGFLTESTEGKAAGRRISIAAEVGDRRVWRAVYSSRWVLKKAK